jgi:hypothetical protein
MCCLTELGFIFQSEYNPHYYHNYNTYIIGLLKEIDTLYKDLWHIVSYW